MKFQEICTLALSAVLLSAASSRAGELGDWVKGLGAEAPAERTQAIEAIVKLGEGAREPLLKILKTDTLKPQQLLLAHKLVGESLIAESPLKALDVSKLVPFGEDKEKKIAGDPNLSIDKDTKHIAMNGEFVLEQGPLEYLVCAKGPNAKLHESIIGVLPRPRDICYALLACNYAYSGEIGEDGKINLPKEAGVMVSVQFEWEKPHAKLGDAPGPKVVVRVPIEVFAWNSQLEKPMKRMPFAFTGSRFEKDPETNKMIFVADIEKSIVAVKLDPYAVMNTLLDTRDIDPQHAVGYSINRYAVPSRGTKCTVIFEPWAGGPIKQSDLKDTAAVPPPPPSPADIPKPK